MKNSKFQFATISTGTYNTSDYSKKVYNTLTGFRKGLKANSCPFEVDDDGLFSDIDGKLKSRQWSIGSKIITANIELT